MDDLGGRVPHDFWKHSYRWFFHQLLPGRPGWVLAYMYSQGLPVGVGQATLEVVDVVMVLFNHSFLRNPLMKVKGKEKKANRVKAICVFFSFGWLLSVAFFLGGWNRCSLVGFCFWRTISPIPKVSGTGDGSEIRRENHLRCCWNPVNNGINYHINWWSPDFSHQQYGLESLQVWHR